MGGRSSAPEEGVAGGPPLAGRGGGDGVGTGPGRWDQRAGEGLMADGGSHRGAGVGSAGAGPAHSTGVVFPWPLGPPELMAALVLA